MKISLRKAHALQKRIEETISNLPFTLSISIDEFDNIPEKIELQKNELLQSIQDKRDLLIVIGGIRDRVAIAGAAYYVSKNLAEIAVIDKLIKMYSDLAKVIPAKDSTETLQKRVEKSIEHRNAHPGAYEVGVYTTLLSQSDIDGFKQKVIELKKNKQNLQDKLLELNLTIEIDLLASEQEILKRFGLI